MEQNYPFEDGWWDAADGLKLHYRDHPGPSDRIPLICIPGLTRNARDFETVAQRAAGARRVICIELRGRGRSGWSSDSSSYAPMVYLQDIEALLVAQGIGRFAAVGTSLGGILTMLLAAMQPGRIMGAFINDIGRAIERVGLARIQSTVGKSQSWPTWIHAARALEEQQRMVYPGYDLSQWLALAKRLFKLSPQGRIVPDYDSKIAELLNTSAGPTPQEALWPAFDALGDVPVTILRGALSDILSAKTARQMAKRLPNARLVTVNGVGHAPALDEPASLRAIDAFLRAIEL